MKEMQSQEATPPAPTPEAIHCGSDCFTLGEIEDMEIEDLQPPRGKSLWEEILDMFSFFTGVCSATSYDNNTCRLVIQTARGRFEYDRVALGRSPARVFEEIGALRRAAR